MPGVSAFDSHYTTVTLPKPSLSKSSSTLRTTTAILDQAVVSGARFVTTVFLGRLCGTEELGVYALTFGLYLLAANLQDALITAPYTVYGNRLPGKPRRALAGSVLVHSLCLSLAMSIILVVGSLLLRSLVDAAQLSTPVLAMACVLPFMLLWEFARRHAIAELRLSRALVLDCMTAAVQLVGIALLAWRNQLSAAAAYLTWGTACACAAIAWFRFFRTQFRPRRAQLLADWWSHWGFGKWVLGGQLIGVLHGYAPGWILLVAVGASGTGVFSACESIVLLSNPLILAISNLAGATTARAYSTGGYLAVRQAVNYATLLSSVAMVMLWLTLVFFGEPALVTLYGEAFRGYGQVIGTIAFAAPLWAVSSVLSVGLRALEKPDVNFRAKATGFTVTVISTAALAVQWGVLGAAYALVAGSATSALWQATAFYRLRPDRSDSSTKG